MAILDAAAAARHDSGTLLLPWRLSLAAPIRALWTEQMFARLGQADALPCHRPH